MRDEDYAFFEGADRLWRELGRERRVILVDGLLSALTKDVLAAIRSLHAEHPLTWWARPRGTVGTFHSHEGAAIREIVAGVASDLKLPTGDPGDYYVAALEQAAGVRPDPDDGTPPASDLDRRLLVVLTRENVRWMSEPALAAEAGADVADVRASLFELRQGWLVISEGGEGERRWSATNLAESAMRELRRGHDG